MTESTLLPAAVTGADLIAWGHRPGPQFPDLLGRAARLRAAGQTPAQIRAALAPLIPPPVVTLPLRASGALGFHEVITATDPDEAANLADVRATMTELMRTPTLRAGAVLPDACPAGPLGTIPVGGVVAAENAIHPGMHSADICCSVMMTDLGPADPRAVLDAAHAVTQFGPGGRAEGARLPVDPALIEAFRANPFLNDDTLIAQARSHMGTQGDGNHFLFVGRSRATGRTALVTHHGSRGPGALLYKAGMAAAERFRAALSPQTLRQNAWLPADSPEGRAYWAALQLIRRWTHANHAVLHDRVAAGFGGARDRVWNEHNFVFERDGLYYHGKGATPAWSGYAADASGLTLVPLNMAEPVLVLRGSDNPRALGFAPHGAGRNYSRSQHRLRMGAVTPAQALAAETAGLDVRFLAGAVDCSELPSSYKRAAHVAAQIEAEGLAVIVDWIDPYGCLMAGDVPPFWRKKGA